MKLTTRKFSMEDFKANEWIAPLLSSLNQTLQELQGLNSNQVTIADNLNQEIIETKFLNDSAAFPIKVKTKFNTQPKGLSVIYCRATDDTTASNTPWLTWSLSNQLLTIDSITNLTTDKTYTIRIHIIYA